MLVAKNNGLVGPRHGRSFEQILVPKREAFSFDIYREYEKAYMNVPNTE